MTWLARKPDQIDAYAKPAGPLPVSSLNVIGGSFWAGYRGIDRAVSRGVAGSIQRRAWDAGKARAKAEPGLPLPASLTGNRPPRVNQSEPE